MFKSFLPAANLVTKQTPKKYFPFAENWKLNLENAPILVRPRHLICLATYTGNRFDLRAIGHWNLITDKINNGAKIEIVGGLDSFCDCSKTNFVCSVLAKGKCDQKQANQRDTMALEDLQTSLYLPEIKFEIGKPFIPTTKLFSHLRTAFMSYAIRTCCTDCNKSRICSAISESNFRNVRAFPMARARKEFTPLFN